MKNITHLLMESLKEKMLENGYVIRALPIERLNDLHKDIEDLRNSDLFSDVINTITTDFYRFTLPDTPYQINSIIVVASPKQFAKVNFTLEGKTISLLHHNYVNISQSTGAQQCLSEFLRLRGYHVAETASLPQKLVAVRGGLAEYGRNNITYVTGLGSLHEIATFYSDMPCTEEHWQEIRQMDLCKTCTACLNSCPTAAITKERYLIKAERCLTYLNEFVWPGIRDFPNWLDTSAHHCIHGCIQCQLHCPKNKEALNHLAGPVEFNDEETLWLLEGKPLRDIPDTTLMKLKSLNLADDYFDLLPRNLRVLFNQ